MSETVDVEADRGGTAIAQEAVNRVINDPYMRHIASLIDSGKFPEPAAAASLREELLEHMGNLITDEETYAAYWA